MSIKDFYNMLFGEFNPDEFELYLGELLSAGSAENTQLERRTAAYMVHVFLSEKKKEPDEPSIEPAFVLKDIYECSSCIRHIAQVFLKGIMLAKDGVFGVRIPVEEEEARNIIKRTIDRSKRFELQCS
ncbi:MAG: hypothetical protein J6X68_01635 [Lachnospiraceae bacterium]|nr:hypothetical protein [Lachnospiraceae bacterium]